MVRRFLDHESPQLFAWRRTVVQIEPHSPHSQSRLTKIDSFHMADFDGL